MQAKAQIEGAARKLPAPPVGSGSVAGICVRKGGGVHETLQHVEITLEGGLVGDRWTLEYDPKRASQVTLMNFAIAKLIEHPGAGFEQAGDNLYLDLDLSEQALPVGSRVRVGQVLLEVSDEPHTGCKFFAARFGYDALNFINDKTQSSQRRRGVNCRVLSAGRVGVGDAVLVEPSERTS